MRIIYEDRNNSLTLYFPLSRRLEIMGEVKSPTETARDIESVTYTTYFDTKAKETSKKRERSKVHVTLDVSAHTES